MSDILDCGHAPDAGKPYGIDPSTGKTLFGWQWAYALDGMRKLCRACQCAQILDCGHPIGPHSEISTGYGTEPGTGRKICFACCAERDRADMIATGRATLYLCGPKPGQINARVTNWPGSLEFVAWGRSSSKHGGGFGAQRTDAWFNGPDGYVWHAVNRGDSQLARCRRTKERVRA